MIAPFVDEILPALKTYYSNQDLLFLFVLFPVNVGHCDTDVVGTNVQHSSLLNYDLRVTQ